MAWMITAGNGKRGQGAASLSIASNENEAACGWRVASSTCHFPRRDMHPLTPAAARVWQDILAQLTTE